MHIAVQSFLKSTAAGRNQTNKQHNADCHRSCHICINDLSCLATRQSNQRRRSSTQNCHASHCSNPPARRHLREAARLRLFLLRSPSKQLLTPAATAMAAPDLLDLLKEVRLRIILLSGPVLPLLSTARTDVSRQSPDMYISESPVATTTTSRPMFSRVVAKGLKGPVADFPADFPAAAESDGTGSWAAAIQGSDRGGSIDGGSGGSGGSDGSGSGGSAAGSRGVKGGGSKRAGKSGGKDGGSAGKSGRSSGSAGRVSGSGGMTTARPKRAARIVRTGSGRSPR